MEFMTLSTTLMGQGFRFKIGPIKLKTYSWIISQSYLLAERNDINRNKTQYLHLRKQI